MVVGILGSQIQMHESQDIDVRKLREVKNIRVHEVEIRRVEVQLGVELSTNVPVMAQLVHQCGRLTVPLELAEPFFLKGRVVRPLRLVCRRGWLLNCRVDAALGLPVHNMEEGAVRPGESDHLAAAGGLVEVLDDSVWERCGLVEVGLILGYPGTT